MIHFKRSANFRYKQPTSLLVHGLTCDHSDWEQVEALLSGTCNTISVDLRGHGRSSALPGPYDTESLAADVVALIEEESLVAPILVGHSMGTRVIASVAKQIPGNVKALVFVDGSRQASGHANSIREDILNSLPKNVALTQWIVNMFAQMFSANTPAALQDRIVKRATATQDSVFRELLSEMLAWDAAQMEDTFGRIKMPLTVLQSTTVDTERQRRSIEKSESSDYLELIKKLVPHSEISIIERCGHFIQIDEPQTVAKHILDILK